MYSVIHKYKIIINVPVSFNALKLNGRVVLAKLYGKRELTIYHNYLRSDKTHYSKERLTYVDLKKYIVTSLNFSDM